MYDKSGIVEFAQALHELGWDLISSGGTARVIAAAGVPVTDVADITGVPAILGHRVVTLHPKVHGGLLADPTNAEHRADMAEYGIEPIELVVANLYPFSSEPSIELIDIGGPTMVRAAAKNHAFVGIVTDPSRYDEVLTELRAEGALTQATRTRLARDAFAHTAAYDAEILAIHRRPGARIWLALDFHGTNKDILYTPLEDDRTFPPRFASAWVAAIQARFPDYEVENTSTHNATEWTFKRWAFETLGAPGITYELGSATPHDRIRKIVSGAADEAMRLLLAAKK